MSTEVKYINPFSLDIKAGSVFGRITLLRDPPSRDGSCYVLGRCQCGTEKLFGLSNLRSGRSRSCGCLHRELASARQLIHGHSQGDHKAASAIYHVWAGMIQRTTNPSCPAYRNYGARGIGVCKRWLSFNNFLSDMGNPPRGMTLERKNNGKGYSPSNCIWASRIEQARNTRSNKLLTLFGKTQCLSAWAEDSGIPYATFHQRLKAGWNPETALTKPVREIKR